MTLVNDPVTRRLVGWWVAIVLLVVGFAIGVNVAFAWRDNLQLELRTNTTPTTESVWHESP